MNDGFFAPWAVIKPDCQPAVLGSSCSRNQIIMSIRGFFFAIVNRLYESRKREPV